jgi:hypothetical protein
MRQVYNSSYQAQFQGLAQVPADLANEKTRKAYQQDITDVTAFLGITRPEKSPTSKVEC